LIGALLVGALCGMALLERYPQGRAGFFDRFLGAIFAIARGVVLVMAFV